MNINTFLTNETYIDTGIKTLNHHIQKAYRNVTQTYIDRGIKTLNHHIKKTYRNATQTVSTHNMSPITDPLLSNIIKNRNKIQKKYQTTNPIFKLQRNILTNKIQKRIIHARNNTWQQKLANIRNTDHTIWQPYKITRGFKTKIYNSTRYNI